MYLAREELRKLLPEIEYNENNEVLIMAALVRLLKGVNHGQEEEGNTGNRQEETAG